MVAERGPVRRGHAFARSVGLSTGSVRQYTKRLADAGYLRVWPEKTGAWSVYATEKGRKVVS